MVNSQEMALALRERRNAQGITLHDVSKQTGLSITTLSRIENGKDGISLNTVEAVAQWLDRPLTDFVIGLPPDAADRPVIDLISSAIMQDSSLTSVQATALAKAFRLLYLAMKEGK